MFDKVLIANRGEIACRIIQACRELKIGTVAVYSEADRDALHVRLADEAVCIGSAPNRDSYLNAANILSAAVITGADAIHPGYGNLSEDYNLADACQECKLKFIGPPKEVMRQMGDKAEARRTVRGAGVPVVPGSDNGVKDVRAAREIAEALGYPIMIKASLGGGGRGIRVVHNPEALSPSLEQARMEARSAFGSGEVYLEKYLANPRHIEVQILADEHGHTIHLGERECSIQYRHQKLIEESPSVAVNPRLRTRLGEAAVKAVESVGYRNAGTVEFLLDSRGHFYFIEMNTRIQVEHPVTEMLTGVDLVAWQLRIAAGERLDLEQGQIWFNGHALECRILAADGERNFVPSPGAITRWEVPSGPGIRVDSGVTCGSVVSTHYDPMVAKVICWAPDRPRAIARMEAALANMRIGGIRTNIPYHLRILGNAYFRRGELDTHFLKRHGAVMEGG